MMARYPYLFALALALPLNSCRIVGQKPDFSVVGDALTPPENDAVLVETRPSGSVPLTDYQRPLPPAPQPPPAQVASASSASPSWLSSSQKQVGSATERTGKSIRASFSQLQQQMHAQPAPAHPGATPRYTASGTYTVMPGDSLSRIARLHQVPLGSLATANGIDLQNPIIKPGQQLRIPRGSAAVVPPPLPTPAPTATPRPAAPAAAPKPAPVVPVRPQAASAAPAGQYRVCAGDTLYRIALRHGITLRELLLANKLDEQGARNVRVGTLLTIPPKP